MGGRPADARCRLHVWRRAVRVLRGRVRRLAVAGGVPPSPDRFGSLAWLPRVPGMRSCMLVLHGFWSAANGLCLWAEDSDRTVKSPSQALRSARPHPFAAPADVITGIHAGKPGTATLLLPSLRSAPLDSPELVRITP